jgi:hypothetical protein
MITLYALMYLGSATVFYAWIARQTSLCEEPAA